MKFGLSDTFTFGMYEGESIADILDKNPSYIKWCIENIKWFEVNDKFKKEVEEQVKLEKERKTSTKSSGGVYDPAPSHRDEVLGIMDWGV